VQVLPELHEQPTKLRKNLNLSTSRVYAKHCYKVEKIFRERHFVVFWEFISETNECCIV
jgi:hypothetical protein